MAEESMTPLEVEETPLTRPIFVPYETTSIDTPLLHHAVRPCVTFANPVLRVLYKIRWFVSYPLTNNRVLPAFVPACNSLPVLKWIPYITVGEVLFLIPLVGVFYLGYNATFSSPSVGGSGTIASYPIVVTFLTASKTNSVFSFLLGVPFERMINWHLAWGCLSVILGCFHYYVCYDNLSEGGQYSKPGPNADFVKFSFDGGTNTTGTLLVLSLFFIVVPSLLPHIRRFFFQLFYYHHMLLAVLILVLGLMHNVTLLAVAIAFWVIDMGMRYVVMAGVLYPHKATIHLLPADVIQLSFPKPKNFDYNPGQYVQIAIPALSVLEFHPFSLSSAPHQDTVTIHVRVLGNWTKRLAALAASKGGETVNIWIEGPYGNLSIDLDNADRYQMVLLISGGIGITPMQSICNSLIHEHTKKGRPLQKLHFVWSVRDHGMVEALNKPKDTATAGGTTIPGGERLSEMLKGTISGGAPNRLGEADFQPDLLEMVALSMSLHPSLHSNANVDVETVLEEGRDDQNHPLQEGTDHFLNTEFYLTGKKKEDVSAGASPYVFAGRPDIPHIFANMKQSAIKHGQSRVAVCVCGPSQLVDACREASRQQSDCFGGVTFDLHEETFEF
jgi:predicted ferric reductase